MSNLNKEKERDASVDDKVLSDCLSISGALKRAKDDDDEDCRRQRRCSASNCSGRVTEGSDI